jgi:ribosomal protein S18 acetylase RimI-like enzyme
MSIAFPRVQDPEQIAQVARLASEIWTRHYRDIVDPAQIDYMLRRFQSPSAIAEQIGQQGYAYHLILWQDQPAGYLAYAPREGGLFLSKIYLRQQYHGQGLGHAAACFVRQQARQQGLDRVWLTVNRHNQQAIRAYRRWGFETVGELVQDIGDGFVMDDYRMEWRQLHFDTERTEA